MVGTRPTEPSARYGRSSARRSATVRTIFMRPPSRSAGSRSSWGGLLGQLGAGRVVTRCGGLGGPYRVLSPRVLAGQPLGGSAQRIEQLGQLRCPAAHGLAVPGDGPLITPSHRTGQRRRTTPTPVLQRGPGQWQEHLTI